MKSDNYCVIFGWMLNELGLSGNNLLIYAVIYGFTQDGCSRYKGGRSYLSNTLNISKSTVDRSLKELVSKGVIKKEICIINGVEFNEYYADIDAVKNCIHPLQNDDGGVVKMNTGCRQNDDGGVVKMTTNNNIRETIKRNDKGNNNIDISNILNAVDLIKNNEQLLLAFLDFIDMRKSIKHPITTERAMKMIVNRTFQLSGGDPDVMIAILDQSIRNNWRDVYELKTGAQMPQKHAADNSNPFSQMLSEEGYK